MSLIWLFFQSFFFFKKKQHAKQTSVNMELMVFIYKYYIDRLLYLHMKDWTLKWKKKSWMLLKLSYIHKNFFKQNNKIKTIKIVDKRFHLKITKYRNL